MAIAVFRCLGGIVIRLPFRLRASIFGERREADGAGVGFMGLVFFFSFFLSFFFFLISCDGGGSGSCGGNNGGCCVFSFGLHSR